MLPSAIQVFWRHGSWRQFWDSNPEFQFSLLAKQADPGCCPLPSSVVRAVLVFGGSEGTLWNILCPSFAVWCFTTLFQSTADPRVKILGILANAISSDDFLLVLINDTCMLKEGHVGVVLVCWQRNPVARFGLYWFSRWNGVLQANTQTQRKTPLA